MTNLGVSADSLLWLGKTCCDSRPGVLALLVRVTEDKTCLRGCGVSDVSLRMQMAAKCVCGVSRCLFRKYAWLPSLWGSSPVGSPILGRIAFTSTHLNSWNTFFLRD